MLTLLSPFTPLLFQGEEWGASAPFPFFTSHPEPELGHAVAQGRLQEFERMGWDPADVPDPQDPATHAAAVLDWSESTTGEHAVVLDAYRRLVRLRRELLEVTDPDLRTVSCTVDEERRVFTMRRGRLLVAVNFGDAEAERRPGRRPRPALHHPDRWARGRRAARATPARRGGPVACFVTLSAAASRATMEA